MLRHLPPTATPLKLTDLKHGLNPPPQAQSQFQAALAQYLGVPACYLASSGRTALYLLLHSLSEQADHPGRREILLPAYTCPVLAKVALDLNLYPRLVDIAPSTLTFDPDQLAASIGEQTLAVICVHPFGIPQPIEEVITLADSVGAVVIEDAAQSMGARLAGRPAGSRGDFGLFSLGPGKPLSTGGGGILSINNTDYLPRLAEAWQRLSPPSALQSKWLFLRLALFGLAFHPFGWWLATRIGLHRLGDHEAGWGYTLRGLTPAQANIGLTLLAGLDAVNRRRRENACRLIAHLQDLDFVQFPHPPTEAEDLRRCPPGYTSEAKIPPSGELEGGRRSDRVEDPTSEAKVLPSGGLGGGRRSDRAKPIYLRLPLLVESEERREYLFRHLWRAGIGVGRMYRRTLAEYFPQLAPATYPGADYVARHLLTLPTHHYLTQGDIKRITQIFQVFT